MKYIILITFLISFKSFGALSESDCASKVIVEITKLNPTANSPELTTYWEAICKGVLDHIKENATVTGQDSVSGPISRTPSHPMSLPSISLWEPPRSCAVCILRMW